MSDEPEARGVTNPRVIDLITLDKESDEVVLLMVEDRPWGIDPEQLKQIEEKINSYLAYALAQNLTRDYPQYEGKPVRLQLECVAAPGDAEKPFLTAASNFCASEGLGFAVSIRDA